jgi:hypothetical protein
MPLSAYWVSDDTDMSEARALPLSVTSREPGGKEGGYEGCVSTQEGNTKREYLAGSRLAWGLGSF